MADVSFRALRNTALQRMLNRVQTTDPTTVSEADVEALLETTEIHWAKLEQANEAVLASAADEAAIQVQFTAYAPMEENYIRVKAALKTLKRQVASPAATAAPIPPPTHNIKLPNMPLPKFDGKYEDWPTFSDLFTASFHNNSSLSGSQKLQYLQASLTGDAASTVKSFSITDVNYAEAWSLLEKQYDNKREIITSHLKRFLYQPSLKHESASSLQEMLNTTQHCIRSLKGLGRETDKWDDFLVVILVEKFDADTKAEWARSLKGTTMSTFQDLEDFVTQHIRTLHAKGSVHQSMSKVSVVNSGSPPRRLNAHHASVQSCQHCKGAHLLYQCTILKDMSPDQRHEIVKSLKLCYNCLRDGHSYKECRSESRCRRCNKPHNTFLHFDQLSSSSEHLTGQQSDISSQLQTSHHSSVVQQGNSNSNPQINVLSNSLTSDSPSLLKTALVDVFDANNVKGQVRVFIDEGAEGSLITERTMRRLGLQKQRTDFLVSGVCGTLASKCKWRTQLRLFSKINNQHIDVELFAVPKITNSINRLSHHRPNTWNHLKELQLADPLYYESGDIDILIGADTAPYILKPSIRRAGRNEPIAQDTIFGWVLTGNVTVTQQSSSSSITINHFNLESIDKLSKSGSTDTSSKLGSSNTLDKMCTESRSGSSHVKCFNTTLAALVPSFTFMFLSLIQCILHVTTLFQFVKAKLKCGKHVEILRSGIHLIMLHNHLSAHLAISDVHLNTLTGGLPPTHSTFQKCLILGRYILESMQICLSVILLLYNVANGFQSFSNKVDN